MSEWHRVPLGQLVDVLDSQRKPVNADERSGRVGDVPYYGANGQQGWIDAPLFNEPLILIAEDGGNFDDYETRPIAYRISGPSWVNNHAHIIRARPGVNQSFLFWTLVHRDIRRVISGGTRTKLTQAEMRSIEIEIPRIAEQQQIAEILDTLDDQIRVARDLSLKTFQLKCGLVEQFTSGNWANVALNAIAEHVTSGSRGWAAYYADDGAKFIRIGNLTRRHINLRFDSVVHVRPPSGAEGSRTRLQPEDVLISITADLGIVGVVPKDLGDAYINQHIALVRISDSSRVLPRWVGHYLSSRLGQEEFARLNDQGAKAGLNLPTIGALRVPVPPIRHQVTAVEAVDEVDSRIAQYQDLRSKLELLKQGLMADLLTGRVRVPAEAAS